MATQKFKAAVQFIINECKDNPARLGAIRLNKTLWFADTVAYKMSGSSITGEKYLKREKGPVPAHILATLEELRNEGKIHVIEPQFKFDTRKYIPAEPASSSSLSDDERNLIKAVLDTVLGYTANDISEETHDSIWDAAEDGEPIPLCATLVSAKGDVTESMRVWAKKMMAKAA